MAADRVPVPRLLSRSGSMWFAVAVAAVGVPAVIAWALVTQPLANQVAAVVLGVVVLGVLLVLVSRRTWLDTSGGALVRSTAGLSGRGVAWSEAEVLGIRSNNAGQALLEVRGAGRRTSAYVPLVAVDLGGDRSQSPEFLRTLADQLEQWAPRQGAVTKVLRAQAEYVSGGGSVRESPIARAHLSGRGRRDGS